MIKFRIHGRGGQGGVTLAKILAFMYWTGGKWVQAFGSYSAERTGAPILAFTLIDDVEITNRSLVYYPDNLVILDPTLIGDNIFSGLQPNAFIVIDTPHQPEHFNKFSGHRVATIDAKRIARKYKLGTKATPISNTAIAGAFAKIFNLDFSVVEKTIDALNFPQSNVDAAKEAYSEVKIGDLIPGETKVVEVRIPDEPVPPLITGNLGAEPNLNVADWKSREPFYTDQNIPPCNFNCPAGNNIQGFITELTQGNYDGALEILKETSPLPGTTSRICPHPCEDFCNRQEIDERVNIHALERLAADKGKINTEKTAARKDKSVAIIGSGPSGLSAGYHLARNGYKAVIYEALPEPGGMLRAGIPDYRLPKNILEEEIKYIIDSGVEIKCGSPIESKGHFNKLLSEFDAVIISIGLSVGRDINLSGSNEANVIQGIEFLRKVNFGEKVSPGSKVIVIGGGNTAIDASRTALRLGAENVSIVYRRSREEMPAIKEEIEAAIDEGIDIRFLYSPYEAITKGNKTFLKVQKMELGEPGEDGRRKPVPVPGAFEEIEFSTLILATGQTAALQFLSDDIKTDYGFIKTDKFGKTSNEKTFATGDVVTNDGTVTHAIGIGRKVAEAVHHFLNGSVMQEDEKKPESMTTAEQMNLYYFDPEKRTNTPEQPVSERIRNFEEVNLGIEEISEAARCLSCGVCNGCLPSGNSKCELFCPERTIHRVTATRLDFNYEGCKGCLICLEVCPRNAIEGRAVKKEEVV